MIILINFCLSFLNQFATMEAKLSYVANFLKFYLLKSVRQLLQLTIVMEVLDTQFRMANSMRYFFL